LNIPIKYSTSSRFWNQAPEPLGILLRITHRSHGLSFRRWF